MKEKLKGRFEIKTTTVGRKEEEGEVKEARILNRVIRVTDGCWEYEADQRHADLIIQETGAAKMSCLSHPGGEQKPIEEEKEEELVGAEATRFRAVAARSDYLREVSQNANPKSSRRHRRSRQACPNTTP